MPYVRYILHKKWTGFLGILTTIFHFFKTRKEKKSLWYVDICKYYLLKTDIIVNICKTLEKNTPVFDIIHIIKKFNALLFFSKIHKVLSFFPNMINRNLRIKSVKNVTQILLYFKTINQCYKVYFWWKIIFYKLFS